MKDQFRDGNVPAEHGILDFAKAAFAALPPSVTHRYFRGDSACYTSDPIIWLDDQGIEFAISADMGESLSAEVAKLHGGRWMPYRQEDGPSLTEERECAEIHDFQPEWTDRRKRKGGLRFIAIRVRSRQADLFGSKSWKHFAIVTNRPVAAASALRWHRGKAGTVEKGHAIVKNDLAGGVMPCSRFGANAAWWRINTLVHNTLEVMKAEALPKPMADLRAKALRFQVFAHAARIVRHGRELRLRFAEQCAVLQILIKARGLIAELMARLKAPQATGA